MRPQQAQGQFPTWTMQKKTEKRSCVHGVCLKTAACAKQSCHTCIFRSRFHKPLSLKMNGFRRLATVLRCAQDERISFVWRRHLSLRTRCAWLECTFSFLMIRHYCSSVNSTCWLLTSSADNDVQKKPQSFTS